MVSLLCQVGRSRESISHVIIDIDVNYSEVHCMEVPATLRGRVRLVSLESFIASFKMGS